MTDDLMGLMATIIPSLQASQQSGSTPSSSPDPADVQTALAMNPFAVVGGNAAGAPKPQAHYDPYAGAQMAQMANIIRGMNRGYSDQGSDRMAHFVHGQPQGMPPKVGNPQTDFQFQHMSNPMESVGAFLLSPEGQKIMKALQAGGG